MTNIHQISPEQLKQQIDADQIILIDVRETLEHKKKNIHQAQNIPLSKLTIDNIPLEALKTKKLVLHCQIGNRSMIACEKLKNENLPYDIWNLEGGILAWENANLTCGP